MSDIPSLLFVKSETSILAVPRRRLRPHRCDIPLAEGNVAGVDILERESNALSISGVRMPPLGGVTLSKAPLQKLERAERRLSLPALRQNEIPSKRCASLEQLPAGHTREVSDQTPEHVEARRQRRLEANITNLHWEASGSVAVQPEFQAR